MTTPKAGHTFLAVMFLAAALSAGAQEGRGAGKRAPEESTFDRLVVYKTDHIMEAYSGDTPVKTYAVSVGKGGASPKRRSNDNKTPEGTYRIDSRHRSKSFHLFLHVSYPNDDDRKAFKELKKKGKLPKRARIGGAIGIHGEKKGKEWLPHKLIDWTRGGIAVDNDEIEELYKRVKKNAVLVIHP